MRLSESNRIASSKKPSLVLLVGCKVSEDDQSGSFSSR